MKQHWCWIIIAATGFALGLAVGATGCQMPREGIARAQGSAPKIVAVSPSPSAPLATVAPRLGKSPWERPLSKPSLPLAAPLLPMQTATAPLSVSSSDAIPAVLRTASETLLGQGLADPKGGEYREVTVHVGSVWGRDSDMVTHGWLLPERSGEPRLAVCPNGLLYPVLKVGKKASPDADVRAFVRATTALQKDLRGRGTFFDWRDATPEGQSVSHQSLSLLFVPLLLRAGEVNAAEALYRAWEDATTPNVNGNDANRRDPYYYLANRWAWALYDRAVCAHMRGDDSLVVADASRLTHAEPLIEAEVNQRGAVQYPGGNIKASGAKALPFLENLPQLLADAERRRAKPVSPSPELLPVAQNERIAFLITQLENVAETQSGQPGGVGLTASPICEALIAEKNAAGDALLDVLENDKRLTRSVSFGRDFHQGRNLLSVRDAAWGCFAQIAGVSEFKDGSSVAALRTWWKANKNKSQPDRWFDQLAADGATIAEGADYSARLSNNHALSDRWSEAAHNIVTRSDIQTRGMWVEMPRREKDKPLPAFKGESLRGRENPSVSDLLARRADTLQKSATWGFDYQHAANFALILYTWDAKNAQTLPTLQKTMRAILSFQNTQDKGEGHSEQYQITGRLARLTIARVRLGDSGAASEYEDYLRTVTPRYLGFETQSALYALWEGESEPALQAVARRLFTDPKSPWSQMLSDPKSRDGYYAAELFGSQLLLVPTFRDLAVQRLRNKTVAGEIEPQTGKSSSLSVRWADGSQQGSGLKKPTKQHAQTLRICDRVAQALQGLPGVPPWEPFAPEARRDEQCAAIAQYLTKNGARFRHKETYETPLYGFDMGSPFGAIALE